MTRTPTPPDEPPPRHADGESFWRSLEERAGTPEFRAWLTREFPRLSEIFAGAEDGGDGALGMDRRSALKFLGVNMAALGLVGCEPPPEEEVIPYVDRPEEVVPGVPAHYATTLDLAGYANGVVGEVHEGRPTFVRGNPDDPASRGASTPMIHAAVYDLYDPDRATSIREGGEVSTRDRFLAAADTMRNAMQRDGGRGFRLLTGRVTSPSLGRMIETLRRKYPEMQHYVHETVPDDARRRGAEMAFGETLEPRHHLAEARVLLALDADVLGIEEPGFLRHARDFKGSRPLDPEGEPPRRLYAIESAATATGANADHRIPVKASQVDAVVRALAKRLGIEVTGADGGQDIVGADRLREIAADLEEHRGAGAVIAGLAQPAHVHALVNAINVRLENVGRTVTFHPPVARAADGGIGDLAGDIDAGDVETLIVLGGNPAYDAPADLEMPARLAAVPTLVQWALAENETSHHARWLVDAQHPLESWGDGRAADGTAYLRQPLVRPLHGGMGELELLAAFAGEAGRGQRDLVQATWRERRSGAGTFDEFWHRALKRGVVEEAVSEPVAVTPRTGFADRLPPLPEAGGIELQFRPHPLIWDGRFANNGWLQELPDPMSKLVWGNAALVSPGFAEAHGLADGDVIAIEAGGRRLEAPVWQLPGQPAETVLLHLGFGRRKAGRLGTGVGVDAYRLRTTGALWHVAGVKVTKTGRRQALTTTQHHHAMEGRHLVRHADWSHYREAPTFAQHGSGQPPSLYPEPGPGGREEGPPEQSPYAWGMSIDLNACIGCNACIAACQSENNIPIVGEREVARGRDMHWLRIDRYFKGDPANPEVFFQPVPCMHCENAPCEYVCPVEATQHSAEGLNEMIYNRCIGTRYCSQNCPYKVRRFNFFRYTGEPARMPYLAAAQNPDVTVRSRGVMEKCTYCVQRIEKARIAADRDNRRIRDGEPATACQDACPTQAIVFGDIADPATEVARRKAADLDYGMLEELNTRPRTTYTAEVRHRNPAMPKASGDRGEGS